MSVPLEPGHPWSTACPDWERLFEAGLPLVPPLPLFKAEASKALRVFKRLHVPDVIGTPLMAEAGGEWFFAIVEALFGSYDARAQRRMIREVFLLVPKKNGKTSAAAAVMLTALILNRRPQAEYLLVAPSKMIADYAFIQARDTIALDPALSKIFHLQQHIRTITHRKMGARMVVKAADTDAITGSKSTGVLIDETHVFAEKSKAAQVFIEIRGALAARPDGFLIQITTQSKAPPSGVFKAELQNARDVRDGKLILPILPMLYEFPDAWQADGRWKDEANWGLVNPHLGRSVQVDFLRDELMKAEREGADKLALIASQHFNVEIGLALRTDRWNGADHWLKQTDAALTLEEIVRRSEVVVVGIDGGGLDDLLGLCVLGRDRETREWLCWSKAWAHTTVLERRKSEIARLRDFERDGDLVIVERMTDAIEQLASVVASVDEAGVLDKVGLDPYGIGAIVDALAEKGIEGAERVIGVSQGWKLQGAINTAAIKLADGTLRHGGRPLMAWCVGNAKVEPKGSAITITKQAAGTAKIDPLMALFDAVALMSMNPSAAAALDTAAMIV